MCFIGIIALVLAKSDFIPRFQKKFFPVQPDEVEIVMLGNSLTEAGDWKALLDRKDVLNSGKGGSTTTQLMVRMPKEVLDYQPKVCFVMGGINDLTVGVPMDTILDRHDRMAQALDEAGILPVIQSTLYQVAHPKRNIQIDSLNQALEQIAQRYNGKYLDLQPAMSVGGKLNPAYTIDGTHLNEKAYAVWGLAVKQFLQTLEI